MNLASENRELLSDQSRRQRLQTKQGVPDTSLGDIEYEVDMDPYLDPFARFGFEPENMRVVEGETSFSPRTGIVSIQPEYLASKRVQSHEYRHGGLNLLYSMYKLYSKDPEMEEVLENLYPGVGGFFKRYDDSYDDWSEKFPMDGTAEEKQTYLNTNPTPSEYIMELYDEDSSFNRPAEYYPYSEDVAFFTDNGFGEEVSRYYPQLKKGVDYKEDPYEYQNIEHDGMPTYSGPSVIKNAYKGNMSDTLDLNSAEQLAKRSRFQAYRKKEKGRLSANETEEFNQILAAEEMARDFYEREKRNEYTTKKGYAQGGAVMNRMEQGIASIPRQTVIREQPHMLAYITPAEAMLLKQNGGSGLPSHGGVPEFGLWSSTFGGGNSFSQSMQNATGGEDGGSFVGGEWQGDTGDNRPESGVGSYIDAKQGNSGGGATAPLIRVNNAGNGYEVGDRVPILGPTSFFENNQNKPPEGWGAYHGSAANTSDNDGAMSQGRYAAQPMYQAPMPASFAPPTMTPISSGQPTNAGAVPIVDPELPNNPMPVGPNMPIGQRPANKAYTFQELLGMYQNPYA